MIFEIRVADVNTYATLVADDSLDPMSKIFVCDGQAKSWHERPVVKPSREPRKKKNAARADVSYLWTGSLVLNQRAYDALHKLLLPFGQLLEVECQGKIEYQYNITNVLDCLDKDKTEFDENGIVIREAFAPEFDGQEALIFKAPETVRNRMYVNQAAKERIALIIAQENLTGIKFSAPGSWPP
ncbi:hypothetical protein V8J88_08405 [Massilia sp. W12]|uniref:hypothetical protein n=1 Tax=Massilia sp. W12 TaxID=3126507 RepID=UPI0030CAEAFF